MKQNRLPKRVAIAALIACVSLGGALYAQNSDASQEKIRLMITAVQARDSGDLQSSKKALEELVKIDPEDENVQKMLSDVNSDIERQSKGEKAVLVSPEAQAAADAKKAGSVDVAMAGTVAKMQMSVIAAYDLVDEAYSLIDDGNWDAANEKLNFAAAKMESFDNKGECADVVVEINKARAIMAKERAIFAMDAKDAAAAKEFASEYEKFEADKSAAAKFLKEVDEFDNDPYNHTLADTNPNYAARMKKVAVMVEKGRRQYLLGDYQGARITFRQIETLDAHNITAKAYQKLISENLKSAGRLTYESTRSEMLSEVDDAWKRAAVYTGSMNTESGKGQKSVVEQKLNDIVIPNVSFPDPGVPLAQAINTLSELSVDFDKSSDAQKGVNIVPPPPGTETNNVVITLRGQSLGKILTLVTNMAGCQYDIENDIVVVRKASETSSAAMDTADFPISNATVRRMIGLKAAGVSGGDDPFGGGGASAESDNKGEAIKQFFVRAGVKFDDPNSSLAYDGSALLVTNTPRNIEKIRNILLRYNEVKQVEIEAKFMEVNQGALRELAFNWTVMDGNNQLFSTLTKNGTSTIYGNRLLSSVSNTAITGNTDIAIHTTGEAGGVMFAEDKSVPQPVSELAGTINTAKDFTNTVNTLFGIVDDYTLTAYITALDQQQGSDLLCAPKVTVQSGGTATISVSQEMRYPENWGDVQSNVGSSGSSVSGSSTGAAGVTITPGTPQDFTTASVGVTMEVQPTVEEDGSINLTINPTVREFEGFMQYGGVAVAISNGTTVTVPSGFLQPVFSVREVRTSVTIFDGATLVIGGLTREEVITVDDRVPVLGDIPWIGRLFQSKGETREKRNLLIFVTANRISPGGSIGREQFQDMKAGSVYQSPVIISPGGSVQRVPEIEAEPVASK